MVVPHIGDQRYWADRLHGLGVAPAPFSVDGLDGAALADAVEASAMDAPMRQRAAELAAEIAREKGVEAAVAAIEVTAAA